MSILKNKTLLEVLGLLLVLGGGYYWWSSSGSSATLTSSGESTSPLSQEILTTLAQLQTIKLDPAVFTDPAFQSLTDFGVTLPPQQVGRRNPFEPVGKP